MVGWADAWTGRWVRNLSGQHNDSTKSPLIRGVAAPLKFDPELSKATFSAVFSIFDMYRPEAASGVISGVAVD